MQRFGLSQYCEVAKLAAAPSRLGGGDYGTSPRAKPLRAGSSPALTAIKALNAALLFSQYCEVAKLAAAPSRLGGGDYGTSLRAKPLRAGSSTKYMELSGIILPLQQYLHLSFPFT
ncbi:hypothetical protein IX84_03345 [Phaeodactylibacter xiamenensis]|uniref:Uncharacterized protein n=1 Tax=Phaeodactylibacter xiamenensis TaxID=1524460 RepID=A0A098SEI9_9BACT|nr:hypothetical protein IX84_03345 [Phaeodactylibacter xiamenensis]